MEFEVGGKKYVSTKLNARQQFHIAKRLGLAFGMLGDLNPDPAAAVVPFILAVGNLSDADADFVVNACLAVVRRVEPNVQAQPLTAANGQLMFEDISMSDMIQIACVVLEENLSSFFIGLRQQLKAALTPAHSSSDSPAEKISSGGP